VRASALCRCAVEFWTFQISPCAEGSARPEVPEATRRIEGRLEAEELAEQLAGTAQEYRPELSHGLLWVRGSAVGDRTAHDERLAKPGI